MKKKPTTKVKPAVGIPGIKRLEWMDPRKLKANSLNWRTHPNRQRQAFQAMLKANGWAGAALLNETTGNLVDGHMRVDEAIKAGEKTIPVLVGAWTEEQERHVLSTLDPIAAMAGTNASALQSLTESLSSHTKSLEKMSKAHGKALSDLNRDLSTFAAKVESKEAPSVLLERTTTKNRPGPAEIDTTPADMEGVRDNSLKDDVLFETDNPWGIPDLLDNMLSTTVPTSTWNREPETVSDSAWYCYSAGPNTFPSPKERGGGVLGFFTEDFRFEMAWNDTPSFTERLLQQDWGGVCLPDFSTWANWPFPTRLHNLYRTRWCGRYWQEAGVPVIPIIQSLGDTPGLLEIEEVAPLPANIPVAAIQIRTAEKSATDYWVGVADLIKGVIAASRIETLVIYGGTEYGKYLNGHLPKTKKTKFVHLDSFVTKRRSVMRKTK